MQVLNKDNQQQNTETNLQENEEEKELWLGWSEPGPLSSWAPTLTEHLVKIFNTLKTTGKFPSSWIEIIITPVLKTGDKDQKENYRPVSCLPAAAKLIEIFIFEQTSDSMEFMASCPKANMV